MKAEDEGHKSRQADLQKEGQPEGEAAICKCSRGGLARPSGPGQLLLLQQQALHSAKGNGRHSHMEERQVGPPPLRSLSLHAAPNRLEHFKIL